MGNSHKVSHYHTHGFSRNSQPYPASAYYKHASTWPTLPVTILPGVTSTTLEDQSVEDLVEMEKD